VKVFLDTSALYAVLDHNDANHLPAREWWMGCLGGTDVLVISNYILVECSALIQHRLGMDALRALTDEVIPALEIEWVLPDDHHTATAAVLAANRRNLSLVDCSSFAVMRRLGVRHAFTFDRHFAEQGFEVVPTSENQG